MAGNSQSAPLATFRDTNSTAPTETHPSAPLPANSHREGSPVVRPAPPSQQSPPQPPVQSPASKASASKLSLSAGAALQPSNSQRQHHQSSPSSSSQRSGGILAFAQAALDKTFANIAEPRVRTRQSLNRLSTGPDLIFSSAQPSPDKSARLRTSVSNQASSPTASGEGRHSSLSSVLKDPPSQPYSETDPTRPPPIRLTRQDNKMHQTSSRLLRMTDDDRPFTKVSSQLRESRPVAPAQLLPRLGLRGPRYINTSK